MAHKTNRRSLLKTKSASNYIVTHALKAYKKIKRNTIFHLINKEEDEDNDQTFWPFSSNGRLSLSRLC